MTTKLTSAECSKLLKKIQAEYDALSAKESMSCTFLASVGEDPESVRPKYDYAKTRAQLDELALKIRRIKHALNLFNTQTVIPGYGITIDEMLVLIPQLTVSKQRLAAMAARLPKTREDSYAHSGGVIDYRYANYDIDTANADLQRVTDELSNAQLALDAINHSATLELDI